MKPEELVSDIRKYCRAHADKKQVEKYSKFFTEGYDAYGLTRELYEDKVNSLINNTKISMQLVLKAAPLLEIAKSYKPLLVFIEPLMMDEEKKVQQGLGWFLREAWKIKPKETEAFLLKWKNQAPRTIFQYATEKMTVEQKKRFKKEKK